MSFTPVPPSGRQWYSSAIRRGELRRLATMTTLGLLAPRLGRDLTGGKAWRSTSASLARLRAWSQRLRVWPRS